MEKNIEKPEGKERIIFKVFKINYPMLINNTWICSCILKVTSVGR